MPTFRDDLGTLKKWSRNVLLLFFSFSFICCLFNASSILTNLGSKPVWIHLEESSLKIYFSIQKFELETLESISIEYKLFNPCITRCVSIDIRRFGSGMTNDDHIVVSQ